MRLHADAPSTEFNDVFTPSTIHVECELPLINRSPVEPRQTAFAKQSMRQPSAVPMQISPVPVPFAGAGAIGRVPSQQIMPATGFASAAPKSVNFARQATVYPIAESEEYGPEEEEKEYGYESEEEEKKQPNVPQLVNYFQENPTTSYSQRQRRITAPTYRY